MNRRDFLKLAGASIAATAVDLSVVGTLAAQTLPYRPYTADSYWNTPLPTDVGRDPNSDTWTAWLAANAVIPWVKVGGSSGWSSPHYYPTTSDPIVTMAPTKFQVGRPVTFRLPVSATACTARDQMLVVTDLTTNQDVSLFHFSRDAGGQPHAEGMARYWLNSEGLAERIGGTVGNWGHRGLPGFTYQFDQQELAAGVIARRLKFAIPKTGPYAVFPMSDYERNRGGIIPEGAVMRIRPDIDVASRVSGLALVLARNFQQYGIVVGDNSGGNITVKGQGGVDWWTLLNRYDALSGFPVARDWEFIPAGWRP